MMSRLTGENIKKIELLSFANLDIENNNNDIPKIITAMSFELGQLIEDVK